MGPLRELLATDTRQALEFFVVGLRDVSEMPIDRMELLYTASVLAHYTQVSTQTGFEISTPTDLSHVFDHYVLDTDVPLGSTLLEHAGTQCLLFSGFFERQMRRRHNIRWYSDLGAGFFCRAATLESQVAKARLLQRVGENFEPWRRRFARLSQELHDQPYLLRRMSD